MGKSSTGKDTIYRELLKKGLGLTPIVPYTTRPIRMGEVDGREYHFTDEAGYQRLLEAGKVVESRAYDTVHGIWRYFTVAEDSLDLSTGDYCLIGTVEAYVNLKKYFGEEKICPILIDIDDGERLQRALTRERKQKSPRYEEMCRRFLADARDFAEEKLMQAGIEKRFYNHKLCDCIAEIVSYIEAVR